VSSDIEPHLGGGVVGTPGTLFEERGDEMIYISG